MQQAFSRAVQHVCTTALKAELPAPVGWSPAGPEPAHELEERILLAQGAPAANLCHDPPLGLALLHLGVRGGVQAAGVLEGGARGEWRAMAAVPSLGSGRK
jgi:hypothetical protein